MVDKTQIEETLQSLEDKIGDIAVDLPTFIDGMNGAPDSTIVRSGAIVEAIMRSLCRRLRVSFGKIERGALGQLRSAAENKLIANRQELPRPTWDYIAEIQFTRNRAAHTPKYVNEADAKDTLRRLDNICRWYLDDDPIGSVWQTMEQFQQPPPPILIGRSHEVDRVVTHLNNRESVILTGPAGIGKTSILLAAIDKTTAFKKQCFHRVAGSDNRDERLDFLLHDLATVVEPDTQTESESADRRCARLNRVAQRLQILLAIDNVDDDLGRWVVNQVKTRLPNLTLAVTSRNRDWIGFQPIDVDKMSTDDGRDLYRENDGDISGYVDNVDQICGRVHGHPMRIIHLALMSQYKGWTPPELLNNLDDLGISEDIRWLFDEVRNQLPSDCDRVFEIIGLLNSSTIRVDLVQSVASTVTKKQLMAMDNHRIIDMEPRLRWFNVHELFRECCRDLWTGNGMGAESQRRKIASYYCKLFGRHESGCVDRE